MKISTTDTWAAALAHPPSSAELAARVRSAHEQAGKVDGDPGAAPTGPASTPVGSEPISAGAALRTQMEALVEQVLAGHEGADLVGDALAIIVAEQVARLGSPELSEYHHQVVELMRADPVVLQELDEILQGIASEIALRPR